MASTLPKNSAVPSIALGSSTKMKEDLTLELLVMDQFQLRDQYVVVVKPAENDWLLNNWEGERLVLVEANGAARQVVGKFFLERVSTTGGQREIIYAIAFGEQPVVGKVEKIELLVDGENQDG